MFAHRPPQETSHGSASWQIAWRRGSAKIKIQRPDTAQKGLTQSLYASPKWGSTTVSRSPARGTTQSHAALLRPRSQNIQAAELSTSRVHFGELLLEHLVVEYLNMSSFTTFKLNIKHLNWAYPSYGTLNIENWTFELSLTFKLNIEHFYFLP